ncbi:Rz1-like lysis system protein LysC [Erwinia oleae]|uniref:Rz1-like lysis system protein LysC n=1 Tax=Erwinia oleae TaxID=796334 RepID=UPI001F45C16F|nr:Rz1-like lysis system protein LysC [Erwinia oleae]
MKTSASGMGLLFLMLCVGCTGAPPAPAPVAVYNRCPKVSLCPMPGSRPETNGDLSADINQLERALVSCALQVEAVKQCQDETDAETRNPSPGAD